MSRPSIEVIKVGGASLASESGGEDLADWLTANESRVATRVLIAGGGPPVDGLRRLDKHAGTPPAWAHWAAIDAMDANADLLAEWLPTARLTESIDLIGRTDEPRDWVLRTGPWLRRDEPGCPGPRLRIGWETTSDAIAARVAVAFTPKSALTLLKPFDRGVYDTPEAIQALSARGVIDSETPRVVAPLRRLRIACPLRGGSEA